jgi:chromosome segregation protein
MKERREMIEDALGLKIYQWKREESERKLLKTEENMKQVEGLRKEIAPHLSFLKKQVEKIEKTRTLKEELRALYREYCAREHGFISAQKKTLAEEEQKPKQELTQLERRISGVKQALEAANGHDVKTRAVIESEKKLLALRNEREALARELGRLEGEVAAEERLRRERNIGDGQTAVVPVSEIEQIMREADDMGRVEDSGVLRQAFEALKRAVRELLERYRRKYAPPEQGESARAALQEKKRATEKKLFEIQKSESDVAQDEKKLRAEIEKDKDSSRDAEKGLGNRVVKNELSE